MEIMQRKRPRCEPGPGMGTALWPDQKALCQRKNMISGRLCDSLTWGKTLPGGTRFVCDFQKTGLTVSILEKMEKSK